MVRSSLTGGQFSSLGASMRVSSRLSVRDSIARRSARLSMSSGWEFTGAVGTNRNSYGSLDQFSAAGRPDISDIPNEADQSMWTPRSTSFLKPLGLDRSYESIEMSQSDQPAVTEKMDRNFLIFVVVVFGSCGFVQAFPDLTYSFLEKDTLQLSPATATTVSALTAIPWSIKPVYGAISDIAPIRGLRRLPYIVGCLAVLGAGFLYVSVGHLEPSVTAYCTLRVAVEVCLAWLSVCGEAIVVEKSERLTLAQSDLLQSVVKTSNAFFFMSGGVAGSFLYAQTSVQLVMAVVAVLPIASLFILVPMTLSDASDSVETRQSPTDSAGEAQPSVFEYIKLVCGTVSSTKYMLFTIWLLMQDAAPQFRKVTFYFYVDKLDLTETQMATVSAVSQTATLVSALIYPFTFGRRSIHWCFSWGFLVKALCQASSLVLLTHANRHIGISDYYAALFDTFVTAVVTNITMIPLMTLCATMCPVGLEGIFFSFFSSMVNFSTDLLQAQTSTLAMTYFGISAHQFDNVVNFKICVSVLQLLPVAFLWMLPSADELDGVSSIQPVDPGPLRLVGDGVPPMNFNGPDKSGVPTTMTGSNTRSYRATISE